KTASCSSTGRIGSVVIVPSGAKDATFALKAILASGRTTESCRTAEQAPELHVGCIVARRELRFVPHEDLFLPLELRHDCDAVQCDENETCERGTCVPAGGGNPGRCGDAGCGTTDAHDATPPTQPCDTDDDCTVLDDGNRCNGIYRCSARTCQFDP